MRRTGARKQGVKYECFFIIPSVYTKIHRTACCKELKSFRNRNMRRWIEKLFCTQYRLLLCTYVPSLMRLQSASSFRLSQTLWLHGELRPWIARVSFDCRPKTVTIQCWAGTCNRTIPKWLPCIRAKCSCNPAFHLSGGTKLLHWSFHYGIGELQPKAF